MQALPPKGKKPANTPHYNSGVMKDHTNNELKNTSAFSEKKINVFCNFYSTTSSVIFGYILGTNITV
jgi:hypothetical protein